MNSNTARALFFEHANAMAYVDVQLPDGSRSIGSTFHVGEGVFVTARHVVEGNKIIEIKVTEPVPISAKEFFSTVPKDQMDIPGGDLEDNEYIREYEEAFAAATGAAPRFKHWLAPLVVEKGPFYPSNAAFDVAIFKVSGIHPSTGVIKLGAHWDDWVHSGFWHLSDAIILGYPPVPMTNAPTLLAARAEVHTFVIPRHAPSVHFILSAIPRGGFSGGVAISEGGDALGVITSAFTDDVADVRSGFMAVLSIEPIVACLRSNGLWPAIQHQHHSDVMRRRFGFSREAGSQEGRAGDVK